MYLWKCWRDTRSTFFTLLGAVLAVGAFVVYVGLDPFGWIAAKPLEARTVWQFSTDGVLATLLVGLPWAGLVLGALGVGTEFEKGTADFLLTRPRPRWYLLWTSWGLGAAQMVVLVLVGNLFRFARFGNHRGFPRVEGLGDFLRFLVALCTLALVFYSLTYLMTTVARNSAKGTALAGAVIGGYVGLYAWLLLWYEIHIPFFPEVSFRSSHSVADIPLIGAGWLTVCLALAVVAQFSFERAEI